MLVDLFCNDELVIEKCNEIINSMKFGNNDLSNADVLSHLNTQNNVPARIDQHGNIIRKTAQSFNQNLMQPQLNRFATGLYMNQDNDTENSNMDNNT